MISDKELQEERRLCEKVIAEDQFRSTEKMWARSGLRLIKEIERLKANKGRLVEEFEEIDIDYGPPPPSKAVTSKDQPKGIARLKEEGYTVGVDIANDPDLNTTPSTPEAQERTQKRLRNYHDALWPSEDPDSRCTHSREAILREGKPYDIAGEMNDRIREQEWECQYDCEPPKGPFVEQGPIRPIEPQ